MKNPTEVEEGEEDIKGFCENPCLSIKEGHCKWLVTRSLDD
jgi:hypothetical protein